MKEQNRLCNFEYHFYWQTGKAECGREVPQEELLQVTTATLNPDTALIYAHHSVMQCSLGPIKNLSNDLYYCYGRSSAMK